jgi:hypothetical protein
VFAIANFDNHLISSFDDLNDYLIKIKDLEVTIMNDFNVPWFT